MVAQGPDLPIHLGSMPLAVKAVIRAFPSFEAGDVFIHNDPYFGGSHLPDVNVVMPAFHEETLLGFACVRAHWPDIGSNTPGSYGTATEIYGEGLRLPPVRLARAGITNTDVEAIIFLNVRTPEERRGDLRAQIAANLRGVTRLQELAGKHGVGRLLKIMQEVMDYSERMMRAMLAALPDGTASFEELCDGDGVIEEGETEDRPFKIRMTVTKRADTLSVDFAGTDRQVAGPMNAPLNVTASGIYCAIKMVADPTDLVPPNSGCWRPVELTAEPGTVVHAQSPAPVVFANHEISHRVADMLFGALAQLCPGARHGLLPGHLRHPHRGRRGLSQRRPLRLLRDHQGRVRRPAHQGRRQRHVQRHLQYHEHAHRDPRDVLPRARGALRGDPGLGRGGEVPRRLRRRARVAHPGESRPDQRVHGAQRGPALRAGRRRPRRGLPRHPDPARRPRAAAQYQGHLHRAARGTDRDARPGSGGYGPPSERDPARAREDRENGYVGARADCSAGAPRER